MGFWHVYMALHGADGVDDAAVYPYEGWVACRLNRVAVASSVSRVVWAKPQGK
jgi:hypothetical protein